MRRAQIEDELPPSHLPDPLHQRALPAEACGLPLNVLADAFDLAAGGERVELTIDRLPVGEVGERDDAGEARLRPCEAFREFHFAPGLFGPAVAFHEHEAGDGDLRRRRPVIRREESPAQRRYAFQPSIVQLGGIPEMHVRVDDRWSHLLGKLSPSGQKLNPATWRPPSPATILHAHPTKRCRSACPIPSLAATG